MTHSMPNLDTQRSPVASSLPVPVRRAVTAELDPDGNAAGITVSRDARPPSNRKVIRNNGSLTTLPYGENVTFVIFETTRTATKPRRLDQGMPNARALPACHRRHGRLANVHAR